MNVLLIKLKNELVAIATVNEKGKSFLYSIIQELKEDQLIHTELSNTEIKQACNEVDINALNKIKNFNIEHLETNTYL